MLENSWPDKPSLCWTLTMVTWELHCLLCFTFSTLLQNIRRMDKIYQDPPDFLVRGAYMVVFLCVTWYAFKFFRDQAPLFDPGALIGFGVLGCIGVIGFQWRSWDGIIGIILCLMGGCIVSGIFRWRHREQPSGTEQRAVGWQNNSGTGTYRWRSSMETFMAVCKWILGASSSYRITYFLINFFFYAANHSSWIAWTT